MKAKRATYFRAPGKRGWPPTPTWPLFCPLPSHAPRPTTPGPAGSGRAQTFPRWLLPHTDRRIDKDRTGPDLDDRPLSIQYVTESGDRFGQIKLL